MLLATGALFVSAAVRRRQLGKAALRSTLAYLGYGAGRIVSIAVDGRPSGTITAATVVELALGAASLCGARRPTLRPHVRLGWCAAGTRQRRVRRGEPVVLMQPSDV